MNIFKLEKSVIDRIVSEGLIGVYCIGNFVGKKFFVGYLGRSDKDLRRRLLQHAESKKFSLFYFISTETIFEAFRIECREWHRFLKLSNAIHPDAPKNIPYICHYFDASKEIKARLHGGI